MVWLTLGRDRSGGSQDREHAERAKEAEEAIKLGKTITLTSDLLIGPGLTWPLSTFAGKKPPRRKVDLPKPTELMKARDAPLDLDKNLNKTIIVSGAGQNQPGFYCDICRRTHKDSVAYLDHINGRSRKSQPS